MSLMLEKSNQNYEAFVHLKERNCGIPSVHCAYYSCFQKMMYAFKDYFPDEFSRVNLEMKGRRGTLHKTYAKEFFGELSGIDIKRDDVRKMKNNLQNLYNLRLEADYGETEITENKLTSVEQSLTEFRRIFKQTTNY